MLCASFLDPTCLAVTINKFDHVPSGYGRVFNPLPHRSPSFPHVDFAKFAGNPVDCVILFSRVDERPLVALSVTEVPFQT